MTFFTINFLYHLLKEICTFCMCKFQCLKVKSVKRSWVWLDYLEVICGSRRNGLLGKAVMCSLLTLARECVGGKRVFWAWNISFHGEKESIEPVLSILPYSVVFSPILYLMRTSSA